MTPTRLRLPALVAVAATVAASALIAPAAGASASPSGGSAVAPFGSHDWHHATESVDADPAQVVDDVAAGEHVRVVTVVATPGGPQVMTEHATGAQGAAAVVEAAQRDPRLLAVAVDQRVSAMTTNDPSNARQWAFPVMHTQPAWSTSTGAGVIVAVVDSGVDGTHPDLQGALVAGYNARTDRGDHSSPATDPDGHGTHVAGIIAAHANNGIGVAGVAPNARIMPVKALDQDGSGWVSDVAEGIRWAVDHGARVVNLSLGTSDGSVLAPAIEYAAAKDVTVVAAAGNDGDATVEYPAGFPSVISVGALNPNSSRASFSNTGAGVDVAAPGVDILSTVPGGYASYDGTSMASPQVAGVAALVRSVKPHGDLAALIEHSATDHGPVGRDDLFGYGIVDSAAALRAACAETGCIAPVITKTPVVAAPTNQAPATKVFKHQQTVRAPHRLRRDHQRRLADATRQGEPVTRWRSTTRSHCVVRTGSAGERLLVARRPGHCRLKVVASGADEYAPMRTVVSVRITR